MQNNLIKIIKEACKKSFNETPKIELEFPKDSSHGDLSCNAAMQIASKLKKNPKEIAEKIVKKIQNSRFTVKNLEKSPNSLGHIVKRVEVADPGFINFFLTNKAFFNILQNILEKKNKYGAKNIGKGKIVLTDISHPNIAKPMGAHHLLSTIIGDSINRILSFIGYKVVRDNYIGDWGTQFGKLIYAYKTWGDKKTIQKNPIPELLKLYIKFHEKSEKNSDIEEYGRKEFRKLEKGDRENKKLWQWIVNISLNEFNKIYKRLNIEFDIIHGESFYENKMQEIINIGKTKNVFSKGKEGALIAKLNKNEPPFLIQKKDGATLYGTRDLARIKYWEDLYKPVFMINVVDSAQEFYFKQLIETAKRMEITSAFNIHVKFGRMQFKDRKMSTRKGNIILLEKVLDKAVLHASKLTNDKHSAEVVGISAVKYSILSQIRTLNITFDWNKILTLEGSSAPYLQYTYARGKSILRKAKLTKINEDWHQLEKIEKDEKNVIKELMKFPTSIKMAAENYMPHYISNALFDLAKAFNAFYNNNPVLKAEDKTRSLRLSITKAVSTVLRTGLSLLGIECLEKM